MTMCAEVTTPLIAPEPVDPKPFNWPHFRNRSVAVLTGVFWLAVVLLPLLLEPTAVRRERLLFELLARLALALGVIYFVVVPVVIASWPQWRSGKPCLGLPIATQTFVLPLFGGVLSFLAIVMSGPLAALRRGLEDAARNLADSDNLNGWWSAYVITLFTAAGTAFVVCLWLSILRANFVVASRLENTQAGEFDHPLMVVTKGCGSPWLKAGESLLRTAVVILANCFLLHVGSLADALQNRSRSFLSESKIPQDTVTQIRTMLEYLLFLAFLAVIVYAVFLLWDICACAILRKAPRRANTVKQLRRAARFVKHTIRIHANGFAVSLIVFIAIGICFFSYDPRIDPRVAHAVALLVAMFVALPLASYCTISVLLRPPLGELDNDT